MPDLPKLDAGGLEDYATLLDGMAERLGGVAGCDHLLSACLTLSVNMRIRAHDMAWAEETRRRVAEGAR